MGEFETRETLRISLLSERIGHLKGDCESRLREYERLLVSYNRKVNLVSRKTESSIYDHHVLHSLSVCVYEFIPGATIVDWGSGGGLPAIPLAIAQPDVTVFAVDSVFKKTQAVRSMADKLELENLKVWNGRAELWDGTCAYSVSRATAPLPDLWKWHRRVFRRPAAKPNESFWLPGLICLKGGDLDEEVEALRSFEPEARIQIFDLASILGAAYFQEKNIIHVSVGP